MTGPGRILFAGDLGRPRNTSVYILRALRSLGYRVDAADLTAAAACRTLVRLSRTGRHERFICVKGEGLDPLTARTIASRMPAILWYPDVPVMPAWLEAIIPEFGFFFSVSREMRDEASRKFPSTSCLWLSQATRFHEFRVAARKRRLADVAFIGNLNGELYAERRRLIVALAGSGPLDLKCWGPRPDPASMTPAEYRALSSRRGGGTVYSARFKDVVLNSAVVVGCDAGGPQAGFTSAKTYMVLGCGGFYLAKRTAFLEETFEPGRELETWGDLDELRDKIGRYLADDAARRRIAEAGREKVLSLFTYERRMTEMLAAVRPEGRMNHV